MDYEASIEIDDDVVKEYVRDNYAVDSVFPDSEIFEYIQRDHEPQDVFDESVLATWADENGYIKEE